MTSHLLEKQVFVSICPWGKVLKTRKKIDSRNALLSLEKRRG